MIEIETVEQLKEELAKPGLKIVDFWASWCGPCRAFMPLLEQLESESDPEKVTFLKVSIEDLPTLSADYSIRTIPTLKFIKDGQVVDTLVGRHPKEDLEAKIEEFTQ